MMPPRAAVRLTFAAFIVIVVYLSLPSIKRWGDWVWQTNPFSTQYKVEQSFQPTQAELACLQAPSPEAEKTTTKDPIPNEVHFLFGLKNPYHHPEAGSFDFTCYLAVRAAAVALEPDNIFIHYTYLADPPSPDAKADPYTNKWLKRLKPYITLVHHTPAEIEAKQSRGAHVAHLSDILRLEILLERGGIYLDMDSYALRSFSDILQSDRDILLGHEGGNRWGLPNAVIAARANSTFLARWMDSYAGTDLSKEWNYHSVLLPKKMADETPADICALPPDAFFWPTWTWRHVEWMHEPLNGHEAGKWNEEIRRTGGALFDNQLAYHAWSQMARERFMMHLTPQKIRKEDTRFNLLMRRFLEDDVV